MMIKCVRNSEQFFFRRKAIVCHFLNPKCSIFSYYYYSFAFVNAKLLADWLFIYSGGSTNNNELFILFLIRKDGFFFLVAVTHPNTDRDRRNCTLIIERVPLDPHGRRALALS